VFCACEIIKLFSVVFGVIRGVRKFDFGLVKHLTNGDQYFVDETTICRKLTIHCFMGDRKKT
jgi:hypothetical protein